MSFYDTIQHATQLTHTHTQIKKRCYVTALKHNKHENSRYYSYYAEFLRVHTQKYEESEMYHRKSIAKNRCSRSLFKYALLLMATSDFINARKIVQELQQMSNDGLILVLFLFFVFIFFCVKK